MTSCSNVPAGAALGLNWCIDVECFICTGVEFQNKGPEYLIVNFRKLVHDS